MSDYHTLNMYTFRNIGWHQYFDLLNGAIDNSKQSLSTLQQVQGYIYIYIYISHCHGIWEFHILMGVSWSWYSLILKVSSWHGASNNYSIFQPAWSGGVKGGGHGMAYLNFR